MIILPKYIFKYDMKTSAEIYCTSIFLRKIANISYIPTITKSQTSNEARHQVCI